MATPTIRLFRSTDTGAPTLSGTAGAVVSIFDACLKDGYNSKSVQGITRSGSTATVTFATAHGFAADGLTIVRIAGASQSEYNGDFQISNVTSTTFDITVTGTPATPATGTITCKVSPADWTKEFSGTNKAVYRAPSGNRLFLRLDDANPNADSNKSANLRGYETMTDVDTGVGLFPTIAQKSLGITINKSSTANGTTREWVLVADGFEFYFWYANYQTQQYQYRLFHFGDVASEMSSDAYGCLIFGDYGFDVSDLFESTTAIQFISSGGLASDAGHYYARSYTQIGASVQAGKLGNIALGTNRIGKGVLGYPSPANNSLYVSPIFVHDSSVIRGQLKGIYQPLHTRPLGNAAVVQANASPIGRRLFSISQTQGIRELAEIHVDIDGPWR